MTGFTTMLALASSLVFGEKDGYGEVWKASEFRRRSDVAGGEAYVAELRRRPREGLSPVEIQAEDMAEFALYREDPLRREQCIGLLQKAHTQGPETIWGWSALAYLDDFGAKGSVVSPKGDPYLHLGDIAKGVIDFAPKALETEGGALKAAGRAERLRKTELANLPKGVPKDAELKRGSRTHLAILRMRLIDECGTAAVDGVLSARGGEMLFARLWEDERTLEDFLLSGPVFRPAEALKMLMSMYLNDESGWCATEEGRKISVASAINFRPQSKKDVPSEQFLNRMRCWAAYRRLSERGLFDATAAKRDTREWRFIVRDPTSASDILYLNSRPVRGQVAYRHFNCFGEYIFGPNYYKPWRLADWPYWYKVHRVGGICNRQSTYCAVSSNAHGLMSERAGQPNHCAWLLRDEKGVWQIRNDINKYTAGVFLFWGHGYQYIQATERAFADRGAWDRSEQQRFLAAHADSSDALREKLLKASLSACPHNLSAWRDYADFLKAHHANENPVRRREAWVKCLHALARAMPDGRTATWDLVFEALGEMRKEGATDDEVMEELLAAIRKLPEPAARIPEEMNYQGEVLKRALKLFKDDQDRQFKVLVVALEANWGTAHYFTQVLKQGVDTYAKDEQMMGKFFDAFAKIAKHHEKKGEEMSGKGLDWRQLIYATSQSHQRDAFQTLAALRNRFVPLPKGTAYPDRDFGARLVSDRGVVYTGGRVKGDCPEDYPRVIDASPVRAKRPYQMAIKPPEDPWAVVQLQGRCKIAGVRVEGVDLANATISISEDGKEWTQVYAEGAAAMGEIRLELSKNRPTAKFIRIGRTSGASKDPLRLKKILVYGDTLY